MKNNPVVRNTLAEFEENELIIASKLYKEKLFAPLSLGVDPNWKISDFRKFE